VDIKSCKRFDVKYATSGDSFVNYGTNVGRAENGGPENGGPDLG